MIYIGAIVQEFFFFFFSNLTRIWCPTDGVGCIENVSLSDSFSDLYAEIVRYWILLFNKVIYFVGNKFKKL